MEAGHLTVTVEEACLCSGGHCTRAVFDFC